MSKDQPRSSVQRVSQRFSESAATVCALLAMSRPGCIGRAYGPGLGLGPAHTRNRDFAALGGGPALTRSTYPLFSSHSTSGTLSTLTLSHPSLFPPKGEQIIRVTFTITSPRGGRLAHLTLHRTYTLLPLTDSLRLPHILAGGP